MKYSVFDNNGKNIGGYAEYDTAEEAEKEMLFLLYDNHIDCHVAKSVEGRPENDGKID